MEGFLVVIAHSDTALYKGVDRVPAFPSQIREEAAAVEEYALGDYKSIETNLIPSLDLAVELLHKFASSDREFEIIWCNTEEVALSDRKNIQCIDYGYDVASLIADYWSIVNDIPNSSWTNEYRKQLNTFGLFGNRKLAEDYLRDYRLNDEPDADSPFQVIHVMRVDLAQGGISQM